ncbi:hypothetical protein NEOKW01_1779 [Nematocida sp. AWRm80]|nr:hypothetical protein NEOKW01_1779 [Nematocida sp. AWRm80]
MGITSLEGVERVEGAEESVEDKEEDIVFKYKTEESPTGYTGMLLHKERIAPYGSISDMSTVGSIYSEVLNLVFQVTGSKGNIEQEYSPGSVLTVYPENSDYKEFVEEFVFGDTEDISRFKHLDYQAIPMQHQIKNIHKLVILGTEIRMVADINIHSKYIDRLYEISESYDEYYEYIIRAQRTFRELFRDFHLKVSSTTTILTRIFPRYYTISKRENTKYHVTAGIIKRYGTLPVPRVGLCSEYFQYISPETRTEYKLDLKQSNIRTKGNLLVICTGTGISLGRTLINEYITNRLSETTGITLIYGIRSLFYDLMYSTELAQGTPRILSTDKYFCLEYFLNDSFKKLPPARILIVPSRIKEEQSLYHTDQIQEIQQQIPTVLINTLTAVKDTNLSIIPDKNYVTRALDLFTPQELNEYSVIVSGNTRLIKLIGQKIEQITQTKTKIQSECW